MSGAIIVLVGIVWAIVWDAVAARSREKRKKLGAAGQTTSTGVPS